METYAHKIVHRPARWRALALSGLFTFLLAARPAPAAELTSPPDDDAAQVFLTALRRSLLDRTTVRDGKLLPGSGRVVVENIPLLETLLRSGAVPKVLADRMLVRTPQEIKEQAQRTGKDVFFLKIGAPKMRGTEADMADIFVGVDLELAPREPNRIKLCCCSGSDQYRKEGGVWRFASRGLTICS